MKKQSFILLLSTVFFYCGAQVRPYPEQKDKTAYLFVYFTGNKIAEEAIHYAVSADGYNYSALNNNQPVIASKNISSTGGVRDPHILRSEDGTTFYMVVTDMTSSKGWNSNRAMVLMKSTDLVNWQSAVINIQKRFPGHDSLLRVWAPQTIYDQQAGKYMVYWSMKHGSGPDIIYYAYANAGFTDLETEPRQLFYPANGKSCIDGDIVYHDSMYHLFYKTEGHGNGIKKAVAYSLTAGNWKEQEGYMQQTSEAVEGAGIFKLANSDEYILMYDVYMKGRYEFTRSKTLDSFSVVNNVTMNFHPRHGTVINISRAELSKLMAQWGKPAGFPELASNPVLEGYFADPEILYAHKTGKYYIYPTSDGFTGWAGTYFKAFSSADLKNWKDEGVILNLQKDVGWAEKNAWAPCIIEKKITRKKYKYYYYFTAAQKIGVAVANDPAGPFKDSGRPLIDFKPAGINRGQEIDPDVFADPVSGKNYLYWGNGYLAVTELSKDMLAVNKNNIKIITPDKTFREGVYVFYRKGIYYFLWSEDDTRSENYSVRYGTATSPEGPVIVPPDNKILLKDTAKGIYGTGHNSVLQVPHKDEWYIVYHRFWYPGGVKMGRAAGYNREVCMDKLEFNDDGSIRKVQLSL